MKSLFICLFALFMGCAGLKKKKKKVQNAETQNVAAESKQTLSI